MLVFKSVLMLAVFLSGVLVSGVAFSQEPSYAQTIETWRQEREARLTSETGWLTIAGLYWLQEGENRIGSDPSNDIVLPAGSAPAHVGVFTFQNGATSFQAAEGIHVIHNGKAVQSAPLTAGGATDVISVGALTMCWSRTSCLTWADLYKQPLDDILLDYTARQTARPAYQNAAAINYQSMQGTPLYPSQPD